RRIGGGNGRHAGGLLRVMRQGGAAAVRAALGLFMDGCDRWIVDRSAAPIVQPEVSLPGMETFAVVANDGAAEGFFWTPHAHRTGAAITHCHAHHAGTFRS